MTPLVLGDEEVAARLRGSEWARDGDSITREVRTENFAAAIDLVDQIARIAEDHNHHPDILIHGWNRVRLTLSTHSEGGLTELDFQLAKRFDVLLG